MSQFRKPKRAAMLMAVLAGIVGGLPSFSNANERHFTYTYESATLPKGGRELEIWSTLRTGRNNYYSEMDHRLEYEVGLTDRLQTSLYLNFQDVAEADTSVTPSVVRKEFSWEGISSEWKYKMTDPVANVIGSALYAEFSLSNDELEAETKMILDKRFGNNLVAYNLVGEFEWERGIEGTEYEETAITNALGFTHFFKPGVGAGLELNNKTAITNDAHPEYSSLFLGPVVSYATDGWWVSFTSLWQLPAIRRSVNTPNQGLVLDDAERFNARLLFSFHL
jgi:hypothetical protein